MNKVIQILVCWIKSGFLLVVMTTETKQYSALAMIAKTWLFRCDTVQHV